MLTTVSIDPTNLDAAASTILAAWRDSLVVAIETISPPRDVRAFYDQLLPRIGTPHRLAEDVRAGSRETQRTGELWFEVRYDPAYPDAYRHSLNAQPLHTDGSYIPTFPNATLMCCVANAKVGGETVFISGDDLVACLRAENPALLSDLESTMMPHARSGDRRAQSVIRREAGEIHLNWNYYCVAEDAPPNAHALREQLFAFLRDSPGVRSAVVEVKLGPGGAVVWKDERVLHGRNAFQAHEIAERFLWKCAVDVSVFP